MNKRLKELAEQAGLEELGDSDWCSLNHPDVRAEHLERFADLVRQDEREACAKVCDEHNARQNLFAEERYAAHWLASAIRARGNT